MIESFRLKNPPHPGGFVRAEIIEPLGLSVTAAASALGVTRAALSTLLIELSGGTKYGRTFSVLSIAFSVGAFLGPMLAGQLRDEVSPYYIAFIALMLALCLLPFYKFKRIGHNTHFSKTG